MGNTILTGVDISELEKIAKELRKKILNVIFHAGSGHPGGSLSATDILTAVILVVFFNTTLIIPAIQKEIDLS